MIFPHHNYIITLIAGKLSNQEILKDLQKHSLHVPPPKEVNVLRKELILGQEEYFEGKEIVNLSWLHELDIEAMFGYRFNKQVAESIEGIPGAFKVLNDRNMYRTITSLAMSGVTPEDIELIVNGKYDIEYSSEQLDTFLKYFFNISDWSYYEKNDYATSVKDSYLRMFYSMALEEEKDYLMWKLGIAPNKSFDEMLRDMVIDSYYNFKEQSTRNQDQAYKWGTLAIKVQERLDKVEKELNENIDSKADLEAIFEKFVKDATLKSEPKKKKEGKEPFLEYQPETGKEIPRIVKPEELN